MLEKIKKAKAKTWTKLFKQFVHAKTDEERIELGVKAKVLNAVITDLTKEIREEL